MKVNEMGCPRILLADDLPEVRERVTELLRCDFDIVGTAQNGQQAVEAASTLDPDLVPAVHRALQGYKFISLRNRSTLREDPQTGHLNSRLALKRA